MDRWTKQLEDIADKSSLHLKVFGPRDNSMTEVIKWTDTTVGTLNRLGYEVRISRTFFDAGTIQARFYDHLR
jgi:hypothetical protein